MARLSCPHCGATINAPPPTAGKTLKCPSPTCKQAILLPASVANHATAAAPSASRPVPQAKVSPSTSDAIALAELRRELAELKQGRERDLDRQREYEYDRDDCDRDDYDDPPLPRRRVQLVEQTAKSWKALMAIGGLGMVVGIFIAGVGIANRNPALGVPGAGVIALGLCVYIVARVGAWWCHG